MTGNDFCNPGFLTEHELRSLQFRSLGNNIRVAANCMIIDPRQMSIGSNVRIDGFCTLSGAVTIGSNVHIAGYCGLYGRHGIVLADFSGLSARCLLYSASDDYSGEHLTNPTIPEAYTKTTKGAVILGRHVIVGAGTVILPRVTIGDGSAVGSQSLVTKTLGEWGVFAGIPAKRVAERSKKLLEMEAKYLADSA